MREPDDFVGHRKRSDGLLIRRSLFHIRHMPNISLFIASPPLLYYNTTIGGDGMSFQTIEINSSKIIYDKDKTEEYRTDFNKPCDCQDCRNYYKHIENNSELIAFLSAFGVDYHCTEEVLSWDLDNDNDSLIHHEGYYGVFGKIEGDEFEHERHGIKISFQKGACVPCDRTGDFFWICVSGDFPYILEEKRELPVTFSKKLQESSVIGKIKTVFQKKGSIPLK